MLASNGSNLSSHDINKLIDVITAQYDLICERWLKYFNAKQIQFYIYPKLYFIINAKKLAINCELFTMLRLIITILIL